MISKELLIFFFFGRCVSGLRTVVVDLIKRLMEIDPAKRIEVEAVQAHAWMRKVRLVDVI